MPLVEPKIDDRNYQQILNETLARIPVHNPEWSNFNDSDPGITLIQLFSFLVDSLAYRANQIPERNRVKFLRLLGIPMQPPETAQGLIAFSNTRGPLERITLDEGIEVYSGQVPFRTLNGLDVLPIEGKVFYKSVPALADQEVESTKTLYRTLYASLVRPDIKLTLYETKQLAIPVSGADCPVLDLAVDTIDRCLWIAILARSKELVDQTRKAIANKVLTLGIMPSIKENARVLKPAGILNEETQSNLMFEVPNPEHYPSKDDEIKAKYYTLPDSTSTNLLIEPGVVQLRLPKEECLQLWDPLEPSESGAGNLPPLIEDPALQDRIITWIRIRRRPADTKVEENQLNAQISWVGINAARISQRLHVFAEMLGQGSGEPDQTVTLINTPVVPKSVKLTVNGEPWKEIDDLAAAPPEVPRRANGTISNGSTTSASDDEIQAEVYTLDRESGEIRFGDGLRGKRPPLGSIIQASYDYGGGKRGKVGIGAINKAPRLHAGLQITNPLPTWGGNEAETVAEAEKRISGFLRHRDRLVSEEDFEEIAKQTPGVDIGRVEVIPLFHPTNSGIPSPGVVTLMVIPSHDTVQPDAPLPDRFFLQEICRHLYPRRLVTTEVHVCGPEYVPIWVSVGIDVIAGRDFAPLREQVNKELRTFLSPLTGGYEKTGWRLSRIIDAEELKAVVTRVDGVAKVNGLLLAKESGSHQISIEISGLELPRLVGISVQLGNPQSLNDLREGVSDIPGEDRDVEPRMVSIPIVPPECAVE
jgi:hypothetical protein